VRILATAFLLTFCAGCAATRSGTFAIESSPSESTAFRANPARASKSPAQETPAAVIDDESEESQTAPIGQTESAATTILPLNRVDEPNGHLSPGQISSPTQFEEPIASESDWLAQEDRASRQGWFRATTHEFAGEVWQDYTNFYDLETICKFGLGLGAAAICAETSIDSKFDVWFQNNVRSTGTDALTHNIKWLGDGVYTVPIALGFYALGSIAEDVPFAAEASIWGNRTLRGFAVGVPPMLAMQVVLGSDRPGNSPHGSRWTPFVSSHGVSGDAFMGAVPFIAAAGMTDNLLLKASLYTVSFLPAFGRLDYDAHYLSQVGLGWFMAYLSVMAVNDTDIQRFDGHIVPIFGPNQYGVAAEFRW
jgi:hypothetical protein